MGDPLLLPKPGNARSDLLSAVARRIAERLDEPELVAVLLSGSATWGDAAGTSDVDLVVLLDRPPPYREVVHRRITDLLGEAFPQGPLFADVDRLSASWFAESVLEPGGWAHRMSMLPRRLSSARKGAPRAIPALDRSRRPTSR